MAKNKNAFAQQAKDQQTGTDANTDPNADKNTQTDGAETTNDQASADKKELEQLNYKANQMPLTGEEVQRRDELNKSVNG